MAHTFQELIVGGVLVAPFVTYLLLALAAVIVLRPILHFVDLAKLFGHSGLGEFSLFITILCLLILVS
jgi:hypothetical protein